jgi:hypothetical protein
LAKLASTPAISTFIFVDWANTDRIRAIDTRTDRQIMIVKDFVKECVGQRRDCFGVSLCDIEKLNFAGKTCTNKPQMW